MDTLEDFFHSKFGVVKNATILAMAFTRHKSTIYLTAIVEVGFGEQSYITPYSISVGGNYINIVDTADIKHVDDFVKEWKERNKD